ncbi:MAG TPA: aminopeptidase [Solirubrobacteraceae bacterium]|nr:aminopeptidase [Solirubrobacteraceae bacterium]
MTTVNETSSDIDRYTDAMAELVVRFGANVQPGQVVAIGCEPGKEQMVRAIAEHAYRAGAKFVDLSVFDPYLKRARALYGEREDLGYVPPWLGQRVLALGDLHAARISLSGPSAPHALDDVDPELIGLDMLPRLAESMTVVNDQTTNWSIVPGPTEAWASLVHPELEPAAALQRLWADVAHVCRLDEPDPIGAWRTRLSALRRVAAALTEQRFDAIRLHGPGTDLTVGLFASSHWIAADERTVGGIEHRPNLPTEEVFTTPDPERVDGTVTATKPLFTSGTTITGLRVGFERGRVVSIEADEGADVLRGLVAHDDGAARLGELALVDGQGRIGPLDTVFYDTLLDENAASHIALGAGYQVGVTDEADRARVNLSQIHVDFMIGSSEISIDGLRAGGEAVPVMRDHRWQL